MHSDPIADMLTRIRNAIMAGHPSVAVPHSKMKLAIAQILKKEGYVEEVSVVDGDPVATIVIRLKYWGNRRERRSVITNSVSRRAARVLVARYSATSGSGRIGAPTSRLNWVFGCQ